MVWYGLIEPAINKSYCQVAQKTLSSARLGEMSYENRRI